MYQVLGKLLKQNSRFLYSKKFISKLSAADISSEVLHAFEKDLPVVALESTIITHGMPYPKNMETALELEDIVRNQGAVPATVAIMKGQIKVGLNKDMIAELASSKAVKTSRRDFPYVMSKKLNGGTTVAGTLIVAKGVGIHVFATGGIGGVHRGGEETMDVSADLIEIGRSPVAIVCSGVKSILDIEKTLEYLETQGVTVVTYGKNKDFPAFYSASSGFSSPYNVETTEEAARMLHSLLQAQLNSGMLLAVPVPEEFALSGDHIEKAIQQSLQEAEKNGIKGRDVTPYVLEQVRILTSGKSLDTNIALVRNNAKIAAQLAINLKKLSRTKCRQTEGPSVHGKNIPSKETSEKQLLLTEP
ncbi:pseudouridine-5'-phosphate glycosidase-like isoform X1 [Schistocerca cancellata]|uniref:pseudouridine-5'-phosphate glycosidase-like isoform X1 n=1 Tax=Schistocerca cancellata TaxID=274614 RepID=UPI0021177254|nr:pseudouridine-5'-phosphate glycosidase-like isoform X1 [Schistocerca cancellata]